MRRWWHLPEGWLSPLLLLGLVFTATASLQSGAWHVALREALAILTPAMLVGFALGFFLACVRRVPRLLAHIVGPLAGLAWVVQLSGMLRSVYLPTTGQALPFLDPALGSWKDLATELLIRAVILWRTFLRGATGEDMTLFIITLALVSWTMGFLSPWFAFRSRWPAVAVGFPGLVLLLNIFYAPKVPPGYFGFYVFLTIVFLVHYFWKQREAEWQQDRVRYPQEMGRAVLWAGVLLSAILVLGTAFLPTTAGGAEQMGFWERFIQPWREVRSTWERLFSNLGGEFEPQVRLGEYGSAFGLSGARVSPAGVAFEVRSTRSEYLRGLAFDQYDGHGWKSTAELGPLWVMGGEPLPVSREGRVTVVQEITPRLQGGNMVFAYAEPVSVSLPAVAELSAEIYGARRLPDIVAVRSRVTLAEGRPYTVVSYVSVVDKASLRGSGLAYPSEISSRYLQLPADLPPRIGALADRIVAGRLGATIPPTLTGELTLVPRLPGAVAVTVRAVAGQVVSVSPSGGLVRAGLVTPYDAAEAIEEHLRTQYAYREDISAPPPTVDAVDHFLFESKAGYCDYFASAMVVLLRTQGIPARLIRGYAGGSYDQNIGAYVVPARVAHSWVEVYFPTYGWQRFEPTAAGYTSRPRRPEVAGPPATRVPNTPPIEEEDDLKPPRDVERPDLDLERLPPRQRPFPWAAVGVPGGVILLGVLAWGGLALYIGRGLGRLGQASATYERMCRWADLLRMFPSGERTPYEISDHLGGVLPQRRAEIARISSAYVGERFSPRPPDRATVAGARQSWEQLRWVLWTFPLRRLGGRVRQRWTEWRRWWRERFPPVELLEEER